MAQCSFCMGTGRVPCHKCMGSGEVVQAKEWWEADQPWSVGGDRFFTEQILGKKIIGCDVCQGRRWFPCYTCQGTGDDGNPSPTGWD